MCRNQGRPYYWHDSTMIFYLKKKKSEKQNVSIWELLSAWEGLVKWLGGGRLGTEWRRGWRQPRSCCSAASSHLCSAQRAGLAASGVQGQGGAAMGPAAVGPTVMCPAVMGPAVMCAAEGDTALTARSQM